MTVTFVSHTSHRALLDHARNRFVHLAVREPEPAGTAVHDERFRALVTQPPRLPEVVRHGGV